MTASKFFSILFKPEAGFKLVQLKPSAAHASKQTTTANDGQQLSELIICVCHQQWAAITSASPLWVVSENQLRICFATFFVFPSKRGPFCFLARRRRKKGRMCGTRCSSSGSGSGEGHFVLAANEHWFLSLENLRSCCRSQLKNQPWLHFFSLSFSSSSFSSLCKGNRNFDYGSFYFTEALPIKIDWRKDHKNTWMDNCIETPDAAGT